MYLLAIAMGLPAIADLATGNSDWQVFAGSAAVALFVGLIIALFQALTQLQEMTLVFVPKIVVVFGALIFFLPFMLSTLSNYMNNLADRIIGLS